MDEFTHEGLTFDVTDAGAPDAPAFVLLHGFPESRQAWVGVIPRIADAGYRVLAPDQRGYSPRARPAGRRSYRMERLVDDVMAMLDAAGVARAHLAGHDWGGAVAWAAATRHPGRLRTVASLATPHPKAMLGSMLSSAQALRSWYMLAMQVPRVPERLLLGPFRKAFRDQLVRSGLSPDFADGYLERMGEPGALTAMIDWYRALPLTPPSQVGRILVPTLYVYGSGDFALGRRAADMTGRWVQGPYRYEVVEGAGHWLPEEHPGLVAELLVDHAREHDAREVPARVTDPAAGERAGGGRAGQARPRAGS